MWGLEVWLRILVLRKRIFLIELGGEGNEGFNYKNYFCYGMC